MSVATVEGASGIALCASQAILEKREDIARQVIERQFERYPELESRYGRGGRDKCQDDARYHISYLASAVAAENPVLFTDYIGWAKVILARRRVPAADFATHLEILGDVVDECLPAELRAAASRVLGDSLQQFAGLPEDLPGLIEPGGTHAFLAHQYLQALIRGERHNASALILDAVEHGVPVQAIYLEVFQRTQYEIGRLWQINEINVAQEHYCTAATQLIMSQLYPYIFRGEKLGGTFVGACVAGDLHEIGVRMVADFLEMSGWDTYYLGANTPAESIVQTVLARKADVLGISATMAYHIGAVKELIAKVRAEPRCGRIKIVAGGYPFNVAPELWKEVGADGSANDAGAVIDLAGQLTEGRYQR